MVSPDPMVTCPPKIRKLKCRKWERKDCSACEYGEWGSWDVCSMECGGGSMSRFRAVLRGLFAHRGWRIYFIYPTLSLFHIHFIKSSWKKKTKFGNLSLMARSSRFFIYSVWSLRSKDLGHR